MSVNLNAAFRERGLNAKYEGVAARILPITAEVLQEFAAEGGANVGKELVAGDVVVSWQDPETMKRRGDVLDMLGNNDLSIMIRKSDGSDVEINARNIDDAIANLALMVVEDRVNRTELVGKNEASARAHATAVERGEAEGAFEPAKPKFADGAFANIQVLSTAVKARLGAEYRNEFTSSAGVSIAALGELKVGNALRDSLTGAERAKVNEANMLRADIAAIRVVKEIAARPEVDADVLADRLEGAIENLRIRGDRPSAAQMAAMMGNAELANLAFVAMTTTPVSQIHTTRLGPRDANALQQDLRRHEDTTWGAEAIAKTRELLKDKMPGYDFKAKMFSRDGVDILMVADQAGPAIYMWNTETRVVGFDTAPLMLRMVLEDVPTDAELQALRDQLRDLRYDNGGEIDFGFDEQDDLIEAGPAA